MTLPLVKLCSACKQSSSCKELENCDIGFIDWEQYKKINMKSSCTARCDVIYDIPEKIYFIELKSKDFFDVSKSTPDEIYNKLYKKIYYTFEEYNDKIASTKGKQNIYSIVFSKQSVSWNDIGKDVPNSLIKDLLNKRVFPIFDRFDYIHRTFFIHDTLCFLEAKECSEFHQYIKSINNK